MKAGAADSRGTGKSCWTRDVNTMAEDLHVKPVRAHLACSFESLSP